jgi:tetratricopeptide (TPR) repeat protein
MTINGENAPDLNLNELVNLGNAYLLKYDLKKALECYDKAVKLDPDYWTALKVHEIITKAFSENVMF